MLFYASGLSDTFVWHILSINSSVMCIVFCCLSSRSLGRTDECFYRAKECLQQCCYKMQEVNQEEIRVTVKNLQSFDNRVIYAAIEDDLAKEQLVHLQGDVVLIFRENLLVCHNTVRMPLLWDKYSPHRSSLSTELHKYEHINLLQTRQTAPLKNLPIYSKNLSRHRHSNVV